MNSPAIDPQVAAVFAPIVGVLVTVAAVIAVIKIIRGPAMLDRMVASDVLLATIMCGLGAFVAFTGYTDVLIVLLVIALFGFIGSVSVSRYVSRTAQADYTLSSDGDERL